MGPRAGEGVTVHSMCQPGGAVTPGCLVKPYSGCFYDMFLLDGINIEIRGLGRPGGSAVEPERLRE